MLADAPPHYSTFGPPDCDAFQTLPATSRRTGPGRAWLWACLALVVVVGLLCHMLPGRLGPNAQVDLSMSPGSAPHEEWQAYRYMIANGTNYRLYGPASGPHVVCIHGALDFSYTMDPIAARLAAYGYRVLNYDLIGCGHTPRSALYPAYGAKAHIEQLRGLLQALGWADRPVHIIGHSLGAQIAPMYTHEYGNGTVRSLVLMAPPGFRISPEFRYMFPVHCIMEYSV